MNTKNFNGLTKPNANAPSSSGKSGAIDRLPLCRISGVTAACIALLASGSMSYAAPLLLSTTPAGAGGKEPAPNVIVSVDDSGSMDWDVDTDDFTNDTAKKKITVLKNALKNTFGDGTSNSGIIPDNRIRLAFQSMHDNGSFMSNSGARRIRLGATNSMKPFSGAHRTNFNKFIDSLEPSDMTPSHTMMRNVATYMNAPEHVSNPWADNPGTAQTTPYLACRRSYHIFLTDGVWNSQSTTDRPLGGGDGASRTLPDGTQYDPAAKTSRVFKDAYGDATSEAGTLSDLAFGNWAKDFQDGNAGTNQRDSAGNSVSGKTQNMTNSVKSLPKKSGDETFSTTTCKNNNNCIVTPEYWNPKNDPATWQHIQQYTIGFGAGAVNWPNTPSTPVDWDNNNSTRDTYGGDFARLVQGEVSWADVDVAGSDDQYRTQELWHAAINGRGKFYPAKSATDLNAAFTDILSTVIGDTSRPLVSIATSSSRLGTDVSAYIAGFDATRYSGSLVSRPIDPKTGDITAEVSWNAATLLDGISAAYLANRVVLSYSGTAGIGWKTYTSLPTLQKSQLNSNSAGVADGNGQNRLDYIRGDRSKEASKSGGIFRDRDSRLGDIVNSNIWFLGKPASGYSSSSYMAFRSTAAGGMGGRIPMLYVGANDGMLHGFAASNWPAKGTVSVAGGTELLAYIPQGVAEGNLRKLTDPGYSHNYYVDGTPFSGDAYIGATPQWTTVLVGTLGLGGKGYFALDASNPANFTEANAASLVILDTTATTDADMGYIPAPPVIDDSFPSKSRQIVKMNDGRWALVMGNGYNSTNEAPVLLVQYLDGDKSLVKISPCASPRATTACSYKGTNGLSTPQLVDLNGDGKVDVAYAGDLKGNVWKFDLTATSSLSWKVSFGDNGNVRPFFIAKQGAQAFTTAPYWQPHPNGGIMLAIATGRNLTDADQSDTSSTQSVYGLWDRSTFSVSSGVVTITDAKPINLDTDSGVPSTLVAQTIAATATQDTNGKSYYASSNNPVDYSTKFGWYMNWAIGGQRNLQNIRLFDGQKILIQSMIPKVGTSANKETCTASATSERNFVTVVNIFSGKPSAAPVFNPTFGPTDPTNPPPNPKDLTTLEVGGDTSIMNTNNKKNLLTSCPVGQKCGKDELNPSDFFGVRGNWRQTR